MTAPRAVLRAAQIAIALVLIYVLVRSVSPSSLSSLRGQIDVRLWAVALALLLVMYALGAASLLILVSPPPTANRAGLLLAYGHVQAIAFFTPAQTGEALLPLLFSRRGVDAGETAAALVVQRLVTVTITAAVAMLSAAEKVPRGTLPLIALAIAAGTMALVAVVRSRRLRGRFRRIGAFLESIERAARRMVREHRTGLALHVVSMVVRFAVGVAASWVMCLSFGMSVPFLEIAGLSAAVTLAALVPLSPAGLGVTEGIFVASLRTRFSVEQILGACLAGRLLTVILLGAFALMYAARSWKDVGPRDPERQRPGV
jgi:glycosyltransferase 2 family protein